MRFTPFHFGPALFIGLILFSFFDLPTLIVSSVIVDLEPLTVWLFLPSYSLHGFFHSYLGGIIVAVMTAVVMSTIRNPVERIMLAFKLQQKSSFKRILFTSLLGIYSHIFLDSFLYRDIKPFYPLEANPFLGVASLHVRYGVVYGFCGVTFFLGLILYAYKMRSSSYYGSPLVSTGEFKCA